MHNAILIKPKHRHPILPGEWSWRTRARAWIFGMGPEALLGMTAAPITDGESYAVWRVWPAGTSIPKGEAENTRRQSDDATEFHLAQEMTIEDLHQAAKGGARCPANAFWLESSGKHGKEAWQVRYVARKGVPVLDLLVLRDRLGPSARLFVATKSFRMGAINAVIEGKDP